MDPDDFEAYCDAEGGVSVEIDAEGVARIPCVPRQSLLVVQVETMGRMLTEMYAQGMAAEAEWTKRTR